MTSTPAFVPPPHFNFAKRSSMVSVPTASVFAVIYLPLLCWFLVLWLHNPTYVYMTLSMFCLIRIPSFVIRAMLAGNWHHAAENLGLVVADQVLFGVGFFGLLYSAYILILDRELATGHAPPPAHISYKVRRNRTLFRFLLSAAVLLSIVGASMTTPTRSVTTDHTLLALRQASTSIFFVLTVLEAALMVRLGWVMLKDRVNHISHDHLTTGNFGSRYTMSLLSAITILLLVRQTFAMATVNDSPTQNKEHYWYPLITVPELLAVLLYAIPGLVPPKTGSDRDAKRLDMEEQSSCERTLSQVSVSPRDVVLEGRGSDETKVASTSEKQQNLQCDSRSAGSIAGTIPSETNDMSERDAVLETGGDQLNNSVNSDKAGSQNDDEPHVMVSTFGIITGGDLV